MSERMHPLPLYIHPFASTLSSCISPYHIESIPQGKGAALPTISLPVWLIHPALVHTILLLHLRGEETTQGKGQDPSKVRSHHSLGNLEVNKVHQIIWRGKPRLEMMSPTTKHPPPNINIFPPPHNPFPFPFPFPTPITLPNPTSPSHTAKKKTETLLPLPLHLHLPRDDA